MSITRDNRYFASHGVPSVQARLSSIVAQAMDELKSGR